jgi:hypothetical protein
MDIFIMTVVRNYYNNDCTIGKLYLQDKYFSYTLEDIVRPEGIKVPSETAIPAGLYKVQLTLSTRFQKVLPLLVDVPQFEGVRIHGGNRGADTEGCIFVAKKQIDNHTIQGSMADELVTILSNVKKDIYINIVNNVNI